MNKNSKNNSKENTNNIIATNVVTIGSEDLGKSKEEIAAKIAEGTKEPKKDEAEKGAADGMKKMEEKTIEQLQKELNAKIKKLENQQEAARKREIFIKTQGELKELKKTLAKTKEFETDFCKLRLERLASVGYNSEFKPMFTISNSEILTEFCDWLDGKIENKVRELEEELLK
jgi:hypothetical protein